MNGELPILSLRKPLERKGAYVVSQDLRQGVVRFPWSRIITDGVIRNLATKRPPIEGIRVLPYKDLIGYAFDLPRRNYPCGADVMTLLQFIEVKMKDAIVFHYDVHPDAPPVEPRIVEFANLHKRSTVITVPHEHVVIS